MTHFVSALLTVVAVCAVGSTQAGAQVPHDYLPLSPDVTWRFADLDGSVTDVSIASEQEVDGLACQRVEWSAEWSSGRAYQSEAWCPTEAGIRVPYRESVLRNFRYDQPYLLLSWPLESGRSWSDSLTVDGALLSTLDVTVGDEEPVHTPSGDYQALPVVVRVSGGEIVRWYAKEVGMVREATYLTSDGGRTLIEDKKLVEILR